MTDLWRKYPIEGEEGEDSWRANHPHFQDIYRTTYAKGVITDFNKTADDPITVISQVKVKVGEKEYDNWVPLFYHPKSLYWDTTDYEAIDFDQTNKYHKAAWMSFRCGDEVAVFMQAASMGDELIPQYVVGFIDNYPRVGEAVFKVEWTPDTTWDTPPYPILWAYYAAHNIIHHDKNINQFERYDNNEEDYNQEYEAPGALTLENICVTDNFKLDKGVQTSRSIFESWTLQSESLNSSCWGGSPILLCPHGDDEGWWGTVEQIHIYRKLITVRTYYSDCYYFPVGPFLFCYVSPYYIDEDSTEVYIARYQRTCDSPDCTDTLITEWPIAGNTDPFENHYDSIMAGVFSGTLEWQLMTDNAPIEYSVEEVSSTFKNYNQGFVYAEVYTPELWENPNINEMIRQSAYAEWTIYPPESGGYSFWVPPHTKDELVEAGFLNADSTLPEEEAA